VFSQQASEIEEGRHAFVQFVTRYRDANGALRVRVSTIGLPYGPSLPAKHSPLALNICFVQ
jgi:hypothetical protein